MSLVGGGARLLLFQDPGEPWKALSKRNKVGLGCGGAVV